jgi:hypothetical protein
VGNSEELRSPIARNRLRIELSTLHSPISSLGEAVIRGPSCGHKEFEEVEVRDMIFLELRFDRGFED